MSAPLPASWVERIFSRFVAIYGSQKVGSMWADSDIGEVKQVWGAALGRFEPATIGDGIQALIASGKEWPPTLPEFVELCRQASIARRYHGDALKALPAPGGAYTDTEAAKAQLERIKAMVRTTFSKIE